MPLYPNDRRNPAGAIPVYIVAAPGSRSGSTQDNVNAAIPMNIGTTPPTSAISGPIPVRVETGPNPKPWPSDQGQNTGAIPVYQSTGPKAIPAWRVN